MKRLRYLLKLVTVLPTQLQYFRCFRLHYVDTRGDPYTLIVSTLSRSTVQDVCLFYDASGTSGQLSTSECIDMNFKFVSLL